MYLYISIYVFIQFHICIYGHTLIGIHIWTEWRAQKHMEYLFWPTLRSGIMLHFYISIVACYSYVFGVYS